MTTDLAATPDAPLASAIGDAEKYERVQKVRRWGIMHLSWGLIFFGQVFIFEGHFLLPDATHHFAPFLGLLISVSGAVLLTEARRRRWAGIFVESPDPSGWFAALETGKGTNWPRLIWLSAVFLVVFVLLGMAYMNVAFVDQMFRIAIVALFAVTFIGTGRHHRDRTLQVLGYILLLAAIPFGLAFLAMHTTAAVGLLFAPPLLWLGAFRLLAPRRWLDR